MEFTEEQSNQSEKQIPTTSGTPKTPKTSKASKTPILQRAEVAKDLHENDPRQHDVNATSECSLKKELLDEIEIGQQFFQKFIIILKDGYGLNTTKSKATPLISMLLKKQTLVAKIKNDQDKISDDNVEDLSAILNILNKMKEEVETYEFVTRVCAPKKRTQHDVRIGTEFTFTNDELRTITAEGDSAAKVAGPIIKTWADKLSKRYGSKITITKPPKSKAKCACSFTYILSEEPWAWTWTLDVDDGCLETQTQPSSLSDLRSPEIRRIIEEDIFGVAESDELWLEIDRSPRGGGGHISIDAATSFGGNAEVFLIFLQLLQNGHQEWQEYFQDEDNLNAPWLEEMEPIGQNSALEKFNELIEQTLKTIIKRREDATEGRIEMSIAVEAITKFNRRLKNPIAIELSQTDKKKAKNVADNPIHYQAVNIEHMSEGGGAARLELRRISAQQDFDNLVTDVEYIFTVLEAARRIVAERQMARITGT